MLPNAHTPGALRKRVLRWLMALAALFVGTPLLAFACLFAAAYDSSGRAPEGAALTRMHHSPQWRDGHFTNVLPRIDGSWLEMTRRWFGEGNKNRVPNTPVLPVPRDRTSFPPSSPGELAVTWFGHSSLLLDIDGFRVLIDPVWGPRASPFSFVGPARFYPPALPLDQLPKVDVVLISHDHYDHLDMPTVRALADRDMRWLVPLGVGAHLQAWGVPASRITELDWWEAAHLGDLTLTATPARHFSGRSIAFSDQNRTLWAGWALSTPQHRVYYSGDTALFDELVDIGKRLGPFDLTMIEVGAYNRLWTDVHLGPEQAVRAHCLVGGKVMLPVHWGLFDLALHGWTEPIERVLVAAEQAHVQVLAPRPGETVNIGEPHPIDRWWPQLPWETADQHDVHSTHVERLLSLPLPQ